MADNDNSGAGSEMKLLAELVALFGAKKGTDWYLFILLVKVIVVVGFLVWCFCD